MFALGVLLSVYFIAFGLFFVHWWQSLDDVGRSGAGQGFEVDSLLPASNDNNARLI